MNVCRGKRTLDIGMECAVDVRGHALLRRLELEIGPAFPVTQGLVRGFYYMSEKVLK